MIAASPAWADGVLAQNPHVASAARALNSGDLDRAWSELQQALTQPDNSDDALVEIYRLEGIVALYQGNREAARQALEKLFQARPDYALPPGTSPKIRALFAQVQADVRSRRVKPVTLDFTPIESLAAGGPASIQASVRDLPEGARVRFYYRRVGSDTYGALALPTAHGLAQGTLPAAELPISDAPFALEYYVEVDDLAGRRLAGRGDALDPRTAQVRAPESGLAAVAPANEAPVAASADATWYAHWYVWTAVGVVALVGGGAAAYVLTRPKTGSLPLTVTFQ